MTMEKVAEEYKLAQQQHLSTTTMAMASNNSNPQSLEFEIFRTLSNVGFYLLLFPYKIVYDLRRRVYKVRTFRVQQVPCAVLQALTFLHCCNEFRNPMLGSIKTDPKLLFDYFILMSHVVIITVLFTNGWFRRNSVEALVKHLQQVGRGGGGSKGLTAAAPPTSLFTATLMRSQVFRAKLIIGLLAIPGFIYYFWSSDISRSWNLIDMYRKAAGDARFSFGLQATKGGFGNLTSDILWAPSTIILTPIHLISDAHRNCAISITDMVMVTTAFIALRISKQFAEDIKVESSAAMVIQLYKTLKLTFAKLNDAFGGPIFALLFSVIPYYSSKLAESLELKDVAANLLFLLFFAYYGVGLVMASEAHRNASKVKEWLSDREEDALLMLDISKESLQLFMYELSWYEIGIKGTGGILTITYGLLGTLMSLILTYSVIMVQLQSTKVATVET